MFSTTYSIVALFTVQTIKFLVYVKLFNWANILSCLPLYLIWLCIFLFKPFTLIFGLPFITIISGIRYYVIFIDNLSHFCGLVIYIQIPKYCLNLWFFSLTFKINSSVTLNIFNLIMGLNTTINSLINFVTKIVSKCVLHTPKRLNKMASLSVCFILSTTFSILFCSCSPSSHILGWSYSYGYSSPQPSSLNRPSQWHSLLQLYLKHLTYTHFRIFRCLCFPHVVTPRKLCAKTTPCIFFVYP